jgi:hypothetical protein
MPEFVDFTPYIFSKNNFEDNPNLCALFKLLAIETWKRIEFTYIKPYIRVYETTLTQNIAFTINAYKVKFPELTIDVFEATDEKTNGNDIELIIQFEGHPVDFYAAVQAKKIYRHDRYDKMEHGDQIISLIRYADAQGAVPLYLLYNYVEEFPDLIPTQRELYGCSIVDAFHLRDTYYNAGIRRKRDGTEEPKWILPYFQNLHPNYGFPWHELVCGSSPFKLWETLMNVGRSNEIFSKYRDTNITEDNFSDVYRQNKLPGFIEKGSISFIGWYNSIDKSIIKDNPSLFKESKEEEKKNEFNPKTRFVLKVPSKVIEKRKS